jgi:hypothetical protein
LLRRSSARRAHLLAHVDLALAQKTRQVVRRKIDQYDLVRLVERLSGSVSRTLIPVMPPTMSFELSGAGR